MKNIVLIVLFVALAAAVGVFYHNADVNGKMAVAAFGDVAELQEQLLQVQAELKDTTSNKDKALARAYKAEQDKEKQFYRGLYAACLSNNYKYLVTGAISIDKVLEICQAFASDADNQDAYTSEFPGWDISLEEFVGDQKQKPAPSTPAPKADLNS